MRNTDTDISYSQSYGSFQTVIVAQLVRIGSGSGSGGRWSLRYLTPKPRERDKMWKEYQVLFHILKEKPAGISF